MTKPAGFPAGFFVGEGFEPRSMENFGEHEFLLAESSAKQ
jgi:hypothetical protein